MDAFFELQGKVIVGIMIPGLKDQQLGKIGVNASVSALVAIG
jgi:hypothetical protein